MLAWPEWSVRRISRNSSGSMSTNPSTKNSPESQPGESNYLRINAFAIKEGVSHVKRKEFSRHHRRVSSCGRCPETQWNRYHLRLAGYSDHGFGSPGAGGRAAIHRLSP